MPVAPTTGRPVWIVGSGLEIWMPSDVVPVGPREAIPFKVHVVVGFVNAGF